MMPRMEKSTFTPLYAVLREKLKALRQASGLTQRDLAAKLGREPSFVARVELGERRVDLVEFFWLCRALRVRPEPEVAGLIRDFERLEGTAPRSRRRPGRRRQP